MLVVLPGVVGEPADLLPGHAVRPDHVSAQCEGHGERLLAEGTRRLARVPLHVLGEAAAVCVAGAADRADVRAAGWGHRGKRRAVTGAYRA